MTIVTQYRLQSVGLYDLDTLSVEKFVAHRKGCMLSSEMTLLAKSQRCNYVAKRMHFLNDVNSYEHKHYVKLDELVFRIYRFV